MDNAQFAVSRPVPITLYHRGGMLVTPNERPSNTFVFIRLELLSNVGSLSDTTAPTLQCFHSQEISLVLFIAPIRSGDLLFILAVHIHPEVLCQGPGMTSFQSA